MPDDLVEQEEPLSNRRELMAIAKEMNRAWTKDWRGREEALRSLLLGWAGCINDVIMKMKEDEV